MVLDGAASAGVTSEQWVMACGRHEKEHREREVEIRSGRQKGHPRMFRHFWRWRRPVRGSLGGHPDQDRKSTRLNSSHGYISYAVFCLKKKKITRTRSSYIYYCNYEFAS